MPEYIFVDNDIAMKLSAYALVGHLGRRISEENLQQVILGAAEFVVRRAIRRSGRLNDKIMALNNFDILVNSSISLEPSEEEIALAADLESKAQQAGFDFDTGESILYAMMATRNGYAMLTGDKRAIRAAEALFCEFSEALRQGGRKVICLEQTVLSLLFYVGIKTVRTGVCNEPNIDKAIANCFSCSTSGVNNTAEEGLISYVEHLRTEAPLMLHPGNAPLASPAQKNSVGSH